MTNTDNTATLTDAVAAWNNPGERERYLDVHDPSVVAHGLGPKPLDAQGVRDFYIALWKGFPDAEVTVDDLVAEGDTVAFRFTMRGTHRGEFMGVPGTGNAIEMTGQAFYRFANGKVVERWNNVDIMGLLIQIGALPAPS